jgi:hypothetical protein
MPKLPAFPADIEATLIARAERMLDLAPFVGVDLDALERVRRRFEDRGAVNDPAEPARRADLAALMAGDFDDLVQAYKRMAAAVRRGGEA